MSGETQPDFMNLTPDLVMDAVESHTGLFLDGTLVPYNSYVNRVFGVTDEDENKYIVKFYRPGRWAANAILDEHAFLADCAEADIPVVAPLALARGLLSPADTANITLGEHKGFLFALFPRVRARSFDIYGDDDWIRVGRVVGRLHVAGAKRAAPSRLSMTPADTTARYVDSILENRLVHPDCLDDFARICREAIGTITERFDALAGGKGIRIHGDLHRGNLLDRGEDGISIIDFDDMMTGPAIHDLWLLLPDHLENSMREMNLLLEGYEEFRDFDRRTLELVEPLRFMRHIYFLAWCAVQRNDAGFAERNPDWGTKAFWITETEDLSAQLDWMGRTSVY
jgi:Ser/Thr protein kinase RdoA (MazF antagonist)